MNKVVACAAAVMLLSGCQGGQFKVDGTVTGADDKSVLFLEQSQNGGWVLVDSVHPDGHGNFAFKEESPEFPAIYRVRLNEQAVCFPIDSVDHINLNTSLEGFSTNYTLEGSDQARNMMQIDKEAMQWTGGKAQGPAYEAWKRKVAQQIVTDPAGMVAYYAINKTIDGQPLFDPMNDEDLRIVGAVANSFNSFRPNDPRTQYLVNVLVNGQQRRRQATAPADTIMATEESLIDINLQDGGGTAYSLNKVAAEHRVVLLNFTMLTGDFAPAYNKLLNDIYTQYKGKGLAIYQVGLDPDLVAWRNAAKPLPWITVFDPDGVNSQTVGIYQVQGVPTTFVIANGEVVERVEDGNRLKAAVAKRL